MTCGFSSDWLALYAEDDLDRPARDLTNQHVSGCRQCAAVLAQLRDSQRLLKTLQQERPTAMDCQRMRRSVMESIDQGRLGVSGRWLSIERLCLLGLRRHAYALAAVALVVISVSAVAQNRSLTLDTHPGGAAAIPMFAAGGDALLRPEHYRDWIAVARPAAHHRESGSGTVYINPDAYREYERTRTLPEGTVMVWEAVAQRMRTAPHQPALLLASVKSHARFASGWGFFDFTGANGETARKADPLPDANGCRTCHVRDAMGDQVLTEF